MRILRLQSENFKRLKAVDITPDGDLIPVEGLNGNGKSSVLDSIHAALSVATAKVEMPVRAGEAAAVIRIELGEGETTEMVVTRYFTAEGTTGLKITNGEGFAASSPQTMLDKLVGHISFDPLAFRDLKPEDQAAELRKVVAIVHPETGEPVDLEAIDKAIKRDMDTRRDVNRDGNAMKARIEAMGGVRHVPDDAPNRDEIVAQLAGAAETNRAIDDERRQREARTQNLETLRRDSLNCAEGIRNLEERIANMRTEQAAHDAAYAEGMRASQNEEPLPVPVDTAKLSEQLAEADNVEGNRRHNAERDRLKAEFDALAARSAALTASMKAQHKARVEAIAAAKMPVDGLALKMVEDKLVVMFGEAPFSQASDADRLRVSAGVAMAANPKLRVLRLKDASLLDRNSIEVLRSMAQANDFQIWAEFVGDEGTGIIMEEGEVRGADKPEPLDMPKQRKAKPAPEVNAAQPEVAGAAIAAEEVRAAAEDEPAKTAGNVTPDASKDDATGEVKAPSTLFERMIDEASKPKSMRSFSTKPRT